jgi:hypothetical protein
MDQRLLRPLLAAEFLVAIIAVFTLWSQVGGQYHLDLMFWPWKLGIGLGAAALVVAITASLVHSDGVFTRRVVLQCSLLIVLAVLAGVVTYYYHLNEPQDQDEDENPQQTSQLYDPAAR